MQRDKRGVITPRSQVIRKHRCSYCGREMNHDVRVGGALCCKACEDYMREKKFLDIMDKGGI